MRSHLRYLKYVLAHKWYVLRAGLAIRAHVGVPVNVVAWIWRLLIHDRSKFSPSEWNPYVATFYGPSSEDWLAQRAMLLHEMDEPLTIREAMTRAQEQYARYRLDTKASFNAAWLHHIHHNPHHWQHHILHEDGGRQIVLIPHAVLVYEMVADWLAAGPKALRLHSMREAVAETIVWYAAQHRQMQMRDLVRGTAESVLLGLSQHYGITDAAYDIESAARTRASIVIPGR